MKRLLLFTRYPAPGAAKTRLIPTLGEVGAAQLHRGLAELALSEMNRYEGASAEIWYTGADLSAMAAWLGNDNSFRPQSSGDLGERMADAFRTSFAEGADCIVIAGTDCPDLGADTYAAAFDALATHDVVVGPAVDGGYYLIGLRRQSWPRAEVLFHEVDWGTAQVFDQTRTRIALAGLTHALTAPLVDIDTPKDLPVWQRRVEAATGRPAVCVVIPTLNAGTGFTSTMRSVAAKNVEILVADAGSTDGTCNVAQSFGARVIVAPRGRAVQMNFASAFATGETILFLHSDTKLPNGYVDEVQRALSQDGVIAGAFRFETDYRSWQMRIVGRSTNLRARWLQLPYGDQGIFLRLADFRRLGGFRELPIMDDFDFIVRARRFGRIALAQSAAVTSGRRWRELGVWRTMLRNQATVAMYLAGVSPEKLARYYRGGARVSNESGPTGRAK